MKKKWNIMMLQIARSQVQTQEAKRVYPRETSLVVQWLRLCTPSAGGLGLIPDQGARSYVPQLSIFIQQLKTLWITPKTQCSQINKSYYFFFTLKEEFAPVLSKPKRLLPGWTVGNEIPGRTHTQETTVTLILTHSATHSAGEGHFHWVLDFLTQLLPLLWCLLVPGLQQVTCFSFCRSLLIP